MARLSGAADRFAPFLPFEVAMARFRFSIAALLGLVLFAGVAIAALRAADETWDSALVGLVLIALPVSALLAVNRSGRSRAYWLGFALLGAAYFGATLIPPLEQRMPTTQGLAYLHSKVPAHHNQDVGLRLGARLTSVAFSPDGQRLAGTSARGGWIWDVSTGRLLSGPTGAAETFVRIGHSLLALVLALLGGLLSRWLYQRHHQADQPVIDPTHHVE